MFDVILLVETFVEKKQEKQMDKQLPRNYRWNWTAATRDLARGRPWVGEVIGFRKELKSANFWDNQRRCCSGIDIITNNSTYNIYNIYNRDGVKAIRDLIADKIEANMNNKIIILGDWNAKIGAMGSRQETESERSTRDLEINSEGEDLMELMIDGGLSILNGNKPGDWEGEIGHVGYRSQAVLDLGSANDEACNEITHFKIGSQVQSGHFPIELSLQEVEREIPEEFIWLPNLRERNQSTYKQRLEASRTGKMPTWDVLANRMRAAMPRKIVRKGRSPNPWWNEACFLARQKSNRDLKIGKETNDYESYHEARKEYKRIIKESKNEAQDRKKGELKNIINIRDGWKYITNYRRGRECKPIMPEPQEITNHFMSLLSGRPERALALMDSRSISTPPSALAKPSSIGY